MEEAAETLPGVTSRQIMDRLTLLLLPDKLQTAVNNETLTQERALAYASFRELDDFEQMQQQILSLYDRHQNRDRDPSPDAIRQDVSDKIEEIEKEKNRRAELIEQWLQTAAGRREKVYEQIGDATENPDLEALQRIQQRMRSEDESFEEAAAELGPDLLQGDDTTQFVVYDEVAEEYHAISDIDPEDLPDVTGVNGSVLRLAERYAEAAKTLRNKLSLDREDEIDDRIAALESKKNDLESTKRRMEDDHLDHCPYCHSNTSVRTLEDEIEQIDSEVKSLQGDIDAISDARQALRDKRSDIREATQKYRESLTKLMKEEAGADKEHPILHIEVEENGDGEETVDARLNEDLGRFDEFDDEDATNLIEDGTYMALE